MCVSFQLTISRGFDESRNPHSYDVHRAQRRRRRRRRPLRHLRQPDVEGDDVRLRKSL